MAGYLGRIDEFDENVEYRGTVTLNELNNSLKLIKLQRMIKKLQYLSRLWVVVNTKNLETLFHPQNPLNYHTKK